MIRHIRIPGPPQGKGRPRFAKNGGHAYTPVKTAVYERLVVQVYKLSFPNQEPLTGPLEVKIDAYMPIPESWPKSKKAAALAELIQPTVKPDADNIGKVIADALNGVAWQDDKQITSMTVRKRYGALPRVEVEIWQP